MGDNSLFQVRHQCFQPKTTLVSLPILCCCILQEQDAGVQERSSPRSPTKGGTGAAKKVSGSPRAFKGAAGGMRRMIFDSMICSKETFIVEEDTTAKEDTSKEEEEQEEEDEEDEDQFLR